MRGSDNRRRWNRFLAAWAIAMNLCVVPYRASAGEADRLWQAWGEEIRASKCVELKITPARQTIRRPRQNRCRSQTPWFCRSTTGSSSCPNEDGYIEITGTWASIPDSPSETRRANADPVERDAVGESRQKGRG